jgi:hypothetical protein
MAGSWNTTFAATFLSRLYSQILFKSIWVGRMFGVLFYAWILELHDLVNVVRDNTVDTLYEAKYILSK